MKTPAEPNTTQQLPSHYSGVISKNNDNAGNEYKLSINYKRAMEKQKGETQNKPKLSSIYG
jgi:hypothetical protein